VNAILTIAALTLREAVARRLVTALAVLTLAVVALSGWGFVRLTVAHGRSGAPLSSVELAATTSAITLFLAFVFSFVLAIGAAFVTAPVLAADVESGVALALVTRPIRRSDIVLGRWLGLATLVPSYVALAGTLELTTIHAITGYAPPHPLSALTYLGASALCLLTLALALSARLPALAGGVVAVALFGMAWIGGIVRQVGTFTGNQGLTDAGVVSSLLLPTDALWRGALYALEPAAVLATVNAPGAGALAAGPFTVEGPPTSAMLAWSAAWLIAVLALAVGLFARRDL